jgi:hypothetical protein
MELKIVDDSGHSAKEPGIRKLLVEVSCLTCVQVELEADWF